MVVPSEENLFYSEIRNCKSKVDDQTQQSAVLIEYGSLNRSLSRIILLKEKFWLWV